MPSSKNRAGPLLAAALGLALVAAGCGKEAKTATPGGPGGRPMGPPEVGVLVIEPKPVAVTTDLPGRTSAFGIAEVRPQVGGIVQKRLFTEGSDVKAGELLYQIDASTYQAAYANAQAALARAKASQANAEAAYAKAKATYASAKAASTKARAAHANVKAAHTRATTGQAAAKAALARAEANAVPLRLKAERFRELLAINAVSRQDADDAAAAVVRAEAEIQSAEAGLGGSAADSEGAAAAAAAAQAEIESAEAAVKGGEAGIEGAAASVKAAAAEVAGAEAALEAARINLAHTRVTAPISGRIGRSAVSVGALVTASQPAALATIQQLDSLYVDVTQSAASLLRLKQSLAKGELREGGREQARVRLLLEDGSAYPLAGTLKFSDVTVDPSTGSVTLRTVFPNPKHLLLPGMYVRAVLEEGTNDRAILVPQRGVTRNPAGQPLVMVVGAGDKVEPRVIKADRTVGESWLVTEGLKPGDRVILEGIQRAKPGTVVKAVLSDQSSVVGSGPKSKD
ncbi:MAG: efflux RND transporter periplasmic adaptor subunit [Deltaproteobacteria bacterium]|nr:efflux RND transporter periplasmic adaptor subunit [Deltaproteobacteria bacterium]